MQKIVLSLFFLSSPLFAAQKTQLDLAEVFGASPFIYSTLLILSLFSFVLWGYTLLTINQDKMIPESLVKQLRGLILEGRYDAAYRCCQNSKNLFANIISSAIVSRKYGHQVMIETMQAEGKRCGITLWQRLALLNDVAIISPMLGLLGTVLGLFYAFYDMNRSPDTLISIFDGLGIAVGTTVAGLIVAIFAMIFYATLKFRVVKLLNTLENEALVFGNLIET